MISTRTWLCHPNGVATSLRGGGNLRNFITMFDALTIIWVNGGE